MTRRAAVAIVDRFRPRTDRAFVRRVVAATLAHVGRGDLAVTVLLTDDAEIAALHGRYLGDATPTDVMSFALDEGVELVVSVETARRVARRDRHTANAELALYIVHGILHAVGFDDVAARDRRRMRIAEQAVLARLRLRVRAVDA